MATIPIIDLSAFMANVGVVSGHEPTTDQLRVASEIDDANKTFGFFGVRNFGLSREEVQRYFDDAEELFAMPEELKAKLKRAGVDDRGYIPPDRKEVAHDGLQVEKEAFKVRADTDFTYCPENFKQSSVKLFERLEEVKRRYCLAIGLAAGVSPDVVWEMHSKSDYTSIRYNHYPPIEDLQDSLQGRHFRLGAHTDFGTQTFLLLKDGAHGLEVQPRHLNYWLEVKLPENVYCVVNIGDMWETLSNGKWKAIRHRVVLRRSEQAAVDRYSIACFLNPRGDTKIAPFPKLVQTATPSPYKSFLAGDYFNRRISQILDSTYVMEEKAPE